MGIFHSSQNLLESNGQLRDDKKSIIHKGLANSTGLYHCFLNVVIQSLWHLREFRNRFQILNDSHNHGSINPPPPCIFCSLKLIFINYQFSDSNIIPPDHLRNALHQLFKTPLNPQPIPSNPNSNDPSHSKDTPLLSDSLNPNLQSSHNHTVHSGQSHPSPFNNDHPIMNNQTLSQHSISIQNNNNNNMTYNDNTHQSHVNHNNDNNDMKSLVYDNFPAISEVVPVPDDYSNNNLLTNVSQAPSAPEVSFELPESKSETNSDISFSEKASSYPSKPSDNASASSNKSNVKDKGRFSVGTMCDAEETLQEILKWCHQEAINSQNLNQANKDNKPHSFDPLDVTCQPMCISHTVFGSQILDMHVCTCGATSDPSINSSFLYRVYVNEILQIKKDKPSANFGEVLKMNYALQVFPCPNKSTSCRSRIHRWCLVRPLVFGLMMAWSSESPEREEIKNIFKFIQLDIQLDSFLNLSAPNSKSVVESATYRLRVFIAFYGRHYVAFVFSELFKEWLLLDDQKISKAGSWDNVVQRCEKGKLQPICLFYEQIPPKVAKR